MSGERVVVSGFAGLFPGGGVAWDYFQYVLGFLDLGFDAYYVEDTGCWPAFTGDASPSAATSSVLSHLRRSAEELALTDRWAYRNAIDGEWYGLDDGVRADVIATCEIFVNVSASGRVEDYAHVPVRIFIDSDPMFTQIQLLTGRNLAGKPTGLAQDVAAHTSRCTFGLNVGGTDCLVPETGIEWRPTLQPIRLDDWRVEPVTGARWSTIGNLTATSAISFGGRSWGQKDLELHHILDVPHLRPDLSFSMAAGGGDGTPVPHTMAEHGWEMLDAREVVATPFAYRDFIARSCGELSTAKQSYVLSRSGWFSGRSACYLAAGRPVVAQDTGWSRYLPVGSGLFAFDSGPAALEAIDVVTANPGAHARAAREVADEYFDSRRVLAALVEQESQS